MEMKMFGSIRWGTHALWLIAILLLVITNLLLNVPSGDKVAGFISFAASITSLILGVVAIFYSIISNQGAALSIGALKASSDNIETAARNISDSSVMLADQTRSLLTEFTQINPTVMGMAQKIELLTATSDASLPPKKNEKEEKAARVPNRLAGTVVALYSISLSAKSGIALVPNEIFKDDPNFLEYTKGVLDILVYLSPDGIELVREKVGDTYSYAVKSVGSIDIDEIIRVSESSKIGSVTQLVPMVKKHFYGD